MPSTTSTLLSLSPLAVIQGGTGVSTSTGSSSVVLSVSPTLVTPTLGVATATAVRNGIGSAATPSYSFTTDTGTGIYSIASGQIGLSISGTQTIIFNSLGQRILSGTAANPAHSFVSDTTTGIYNPSAGQVGISCSAVAIANFSSTGLSILNTTNQINLGTTNTVTINAIAPSASRIYAINDLGSSGNLLLSPSLKFVREYNGTTAIASRVRQIVTALSSSGQATFFPTSDGTATGTALFATINGVFPVVTRNTGTPTSFVFSHLASISVDLRTVIVNVGQGTNLGALGGATIVNATDGLTVTALIVGT